MILHGRKWYEMNRNDTKWHQMIWKDLKGYEKILLEPNIWKGLFTRMMEVLFVMWQRQTHATLSGHVWSVYDLAWPKSPNDRDSIVFWFMNKDHSILKVKFDGWTCSTWQMQNLFHKLTAPIHVQHTVPTQSKLVIFFLPVVGRWLMFEQNLTYQPVQAPFISQSSQDLTKVVSKTVALSNLNIKYKRQSPFHFRCFSNHSVPNGMKLIQKLFFCLKVE